MPSAQSLFFRGAGPPDATTIVFLHGGGVGWWMWQPVMSFLEDYRCLALDQPEHGGSSHIKPFTIPLAATKTAELIRDQTSGGRACVVGLSVGAQILVQLLATAPERVERAIISSALLRPVPGLGWLRSPGGLAWIYRMTMAPFKASDRWIRLNMKYAAGIPESYFPSFKQDWQALTEAEFVNLMAANQRFRLPIGLERATAPVLVLAGKKEHRAMKQSARDLLGSLPRAAGGLVSLGEKATAAQEHNWAMTAPELFAATVRAWIEERPLPAPIGSLEGQ
jgi:pimeloyl-ACP methyl ester carboxylesterase